MLPRLHELLDDGWRWRTSLGVAASVVGGLVVGLQVMQGHRGEPKTESSQFGLVELFVADLPPTSIPKTVYTLRRLFATGFRTEIGGLDAILGDRQDMEAVRIAI